MIVSTKGVCGGDPRIDNKRITVEDVVRSLFAGDSIENTKKAYDITDEQIEEVEKYIYELLGEKTIKREEYKMKKYIVCVNNCFDNDMKMIEVEAETEEIAMVLANNDSIEQFKDFKSMTIEDIQDYYNDGDILVSTPIEIGSFKKRLEEE